MTHVPLGLEGVIVDNLVIDQKTERLYDLWEKVQFDKNFDYDYTPDKAEILKDSACSHPTSK